MTTLPNSHWLPLADRETAVAARLRALGIRLVTVVCGAILPKRLPRDEQRTPRTTPRTARHEP